ncbi:MAG: phosphate acetyltransferase [Bifidobacteriaceae bacterium]|jgi:phosphate acetyltransferase|nr:phosphate acetyltransferase [Bifidobacteriaceae bacterium]
MSLETDIFEKAKLNKKTIVLAEPEDLRILKATAILQKENVANIILLGHQPCIENDIKENSIDLTIDDDSVKVINPKDEEYLNKFAEDFAELRKSKGVTLEDAKKQMENVSYFATMLVHEGIADGMVSGAIHTTADTIRPALQIIKTAPGNSLVSGAFLMEIPANAADPSSKAERYVYADCAVNPNPDADALACIAMQSAVTATNFEISPLIAMLSYSTGTSGKGPDVDVCIDATAKAKELIDSVGIKYELEGPIQYDAAVDKDVAATKLPDSKVAGKANVFVFPDLKSGNICYKAVQRSSGALAIGPILQGLNKPVNDLSRGALVKDIVNTVAITAVQAQ